MTEKELMLEGSLYNSNDSFLNQDFLKAKRILRKIHQTAEYESDVRTRLFTELFKHIGDNFYIELPFQCDFGYNISIGKNFYANYDCIIIDSGQVTIGDNVFLGPRVCIYTVGHPIYYEVRNTGLEFGREITIGNNVWIGGNTIINPGIRIKNNVVIGSGSVVTKDIPSGVVAAGNPCRIIRNITKEDEKYWRNEETNYKNSI